MPVYQYDNSDVDIGDEIAAYYGTQSFYSPPPPPVASAEAMMAPAATMAPPAPQQTYTEAPQQAQAPPMTPEQQAEAQAMTPEIDFMVYSQTENSNPQVREPGVVSTSTSIKSKIKRMFKSKKN